MSIAADGPARPTDPSKTRDAIRPLTADQLDHVSGGNGVWAGPNGTGTCTPVGRLK